jgi:DNA (cytosine-5)-methyltransferase 1
VQGFPDGWTLPDRFAANENKLESLRYHAVGNSVTPQVAEWLGRRIQKVKRRILDRTVNETETKITALRG